MRSEDTAIKVLIVDDHRVVRVGLKTVLSDSPRIRVVGEAASVKNGVSEALRLRPDVALLDIRLPDGTGFDASRKIKAAIPSVRVLMLTSYVDDKLVLEAIAAGADGYLLKQVEDQDIAAAIEKVAAGGAVLDPIATRHVVRSMQNGQKGVCSTTPLEQLSLQERRILSLVSSGKTNKEIGIALRLGEKTVRNYLSTVFEKLQVTRRSEAAAWFVRQTEG
jgi:two-component system response regulator DevR